jgi:hypothetical protein
MRLVAVKKVVDVFRSRSCVLNTAEMETGGAGATCILLGLYCNLVAALHPEIKTDRMDGVTENIGSNKPRWVVFFTVPFTYRDGRSLSGPMGGGG